MDLRIYRAMQNKGSNKDRPEELLAYNIITTHLRGIVNHNKQKEIWFNKVNYARLDIEFSINSGQKYATRLQGKPHEQKYSHDRMQEIYLQDLGYIVIDLWYDKLPVLFLRNERILEPDELKFAYTEIKNKFANFGLKFNRFDISLIDQTA